MIKRFLKKWKASQRKLRESFSEPYYNKEQEKDYDMAQNVKHNIPQKT